jgi:hypothetical protein
MRRKVFIVLLLFPLVVDGKTSAVIQERITHINVSKSDNLSIVERIKIKILDEDGYEHCVFRDYYNSFRSIRALRYTIYDVSGNKIKRLGKDDAVDVMFNPSYEVADSRLIYLDPDYRSFPFVVEIEAEIVYNGFIDFPLWMPRYAHNLEVSKATLIFTCPVKYEFRTMAYSGVKAPVVRSVAEFKETTWSVENLPSVPLHQNYATFVTDQPRVHLAPYYFELDKKPGSFKGWKDFGDWYLLLNQSDGLISETTKKHLNEIREAAKDQGELVKQVYRFMQSKTRYVSIQLGIGGYRALPVSEVDKNGYGDCKALSSYTKAMLSYLNISSNYVLVNAGNDVADVISDFPSNQFNHVFLAVPMKSDTVWLECTSQLTPASYLGSFTDDRNALWIESGKSKIIHTPAFTSQQNSKIINCHATVDVDGNVALLIRQQQSGVYFDESIAYKSMNKDQIKNYNNKKFFYKDFAIQSFAFFDNQENKVLDLDFKVNVKNLAKIIDNKLIIPTNILTAVENQLDVDALNKKAKIRRGFTLEEIVTVEIPDNFYAHYIPEVSKELNDIGEIQVNVSVKAPKLIEITRRISIHKGEYKAETWDGFNQFLKKIRLLEQSKIVFQSKT